MDEIEVDGYSEMDDHFANCPACQRSTVRPDGLCEVGAPLWLRWKASLAELER